MRFDIDTHLGFGRVGGLYERFSFHVKVNDFMIVGATMMWQRNLMVCVFGMVLRIPIVTNEVWNRRCN
jgi:hypothetical protein